MGGAKAEITMALIVQKFGGSSLADLDKIKAAAQLVARQYHHGDAVVVVVSAMQGVTDQLTSLVQSLSGDAAREKDAILATGEQVAAASLSAALRALGVPAQSLTGGQVPIITNQEYGKAKILHVGDARLKAHLAERVVPVVTGFQGVSANGDITTLGRGGSDLTAVAIAAALSADHCHIYTDVAGVYTSDPRMVSTATVLECIDFDQILELSSLGAKVLQSRCIEYAGKYQVPLKVLSTFSPDAPGTSISYADDHVESARLSGIALDRHQVHVTLEGIPFRPGVLSYILSPIASAKVAVDMLVQTRPQNNGSRCDLSFALSASDYAIVANMLDELAIECDASQLLVSDGMAKVSLVGAGLRSSTDVISRLVTALGQEGVPIYLLTTGEIKISAIVDTAFASVSVRKLHESFNL